MKKASVLLILICFFLGTASLSQGLLTGPDESQIPREQELLKKRQAFLESEDLSDENKRAQFGAILWQLGKVSAQLFHWEKAHAAYLELFALRLKRNALWRCPLCITGASDEGIQSDYEQLLEWIARYDKNNSKLSDSLPARWTTDGITLSPKRTAVTRIRKWGYIDRAGNWAIKPKFDRASTFNSGLAHVSNGQTGGYIDKAGRWILRPTQGVGDFSEGLAPAQEEVTGKWGFIDIHGEYAIKPQFDDVYGFSEGLACIAKKTSPSPDSDRRYGYINHQGRIVIPVQFDLADQSFHDGLARVWPKDKRYHYIDKTGKKSVTPNFLGNACRFEYFSEGVAPVQEGPNDYYYADKHGQQTVPGEYASAEPFHEGLAIVKLDPHGKFGYIDKSGKLAISAEFDVATQFSEGLAAVCRAGHSYVLDTSGKVLFKLDPRVNVCQYHDGLAAAEFMDYVSPNSGQNPFLLLENARVPE